MERLQLAVGMSGGVDSTVAAWLLKKQGHEVFGVTMSTWSGGVKNPENFKRGCYCSDEAHEIAQAAALAKRIGIPHHVIDLRDAYREHVLDYFRREYLAGRTPNPCIMCNSKVKLGLLLDKISAAGLAFDFFATGHYARVGKSAARYMLKKGLDGKKDQSYFLWGLSQRQLARIMFPLGAMTKQETRALARQAGVEELADKPESQDFVGGGYAGLFAGEDSRPGPVFDTAGKRIGEHKGIIHYTVGQRKGMGLGGLKKPLYVAAVDAGKNAVILGTKDELYVKTAKLTNLNFIAEETLTAPARADIKIRQQHPPTPGTVLPPEGDSAAITFDEPQFAVTPGQSAVFYQGDIVLGGGIIT